MSQDEKFKTMKDILEKFETHRYINNEKILKIEKSSEVFDYLISGLEIFGGAVPGPTAFAAGISGVALRKFVDHGSSKAISRLKAISENYLELTLSQYRKHNSN